MDSASQASRAHWSFCGELSIPLNGFGPGHPCPHPPPPRYLSIPLNGFKAMLASLIKLLTSLILSIPLNGFRQDEDSHGLCLGQVSFNSIEWIRKGKIVYDHQLGLKIFQFHWMDSRVMNWVKKNLIPFQFHWMDSPFQQAHLLQVQSAPGFQFHWMDSRSARSKRYPYWFRGYFQFHWMDSRHRMEVEEVVKLLRSLSIPLNGFIVRSHAGRSENRALAFNSIEWIHGWDSKDETWPKVYFQFHWMDSRPGRLWRRRPSVWRMLSIPLNGFKGRFRLG